MTTENASADDVVRRFNSLPWHDAKLLGLSIDRNEPGADDKVSINVQFFHNGQWLPTSTLTFVGCTLLAIQIDLDGKRACSDAISNAKCYKSSDWTETLSRENPYDNFRGWLHFSITLIPPGGELNVLAIDFTLSPAFP